MAREKFLNDFNDEKIEKIKKKYRSKYKQKAYESYLRNPDKTTDNFEDMWKRSSKNARRLYMSSGRNKEFKNIAERTRVFFADELFYGDTGFTFNSELEKSLAKDMEREFEDTEKEIYNKRTFQFMKNNGENDFKYKDETKSMSEWLEDYNNGKISKEEMNDIIKQYKEQNPDRSMYYANTEENADLQENGFF